MRKHSLTHYLPFVLIILSLVIASLYFSAFDPQEFVKWVGIENAYLILFVLAFFSGILTFTAIPYHLILITFALGGINPLLLGLAATLGVMLGDCTSYLIGYYGRGVLPERVNPFIQKFTHFFDHHFRWYPVFFFLYGALSPFSNDFVGITMGVARFPILRVMIPLGLGNLVFNTAIASFAPYVAGFL